MTHSYLLLALLFNWLCVQVLLNHRLMIWVIMVIWHSIPITVPVAMVIILVHANQLRLLVRFVFMSLLAIHAISTLAIEVTLIWFAHLLPQIACNLAFQQFLVHAVRQG